jgi:UDP-N-acetylmuramoyl-L-alanyl-D-glutamate--2,6-diaminopimelate ligase
MLRPGDTLLMTGKGPDTYQIVGTTKYPFDERAIVLDALGLPA